MSTIERIELYLHLIDCEDPPATVLSREQEAHELLVDAQYEIERLQNLWQTAVDAEGTNWAEDIVKLAEEQAKAGGSDES